MAHTEATLKGLNEPGLIELVLQLESKVNSDIKEFLDFVIVLSPRRSIYITPRNTCTSMLIITVALIFDYMWFKCNLLLLCGDVELDPGPKQNTAKRIYICHWNLNPILHGGG